MSQTVESHCACSDRRWRHPDDGRMGAPAAAVWDSVTEFRVPGALARTLSPRTMRASKHRQGSAGPRRTTARMERALLDRHHLRRTPAIDVRPEVGAIAVLASGARRRDRHGRGAATHLAAATRRRDRILQDGPSHLEQHWFLIGRRTLTTVDAVAFSGFSSRPKEPPTNMTRRSPAKTKSSSESETRRSPP
jgi:hypothetical protein